LPRLNSITITGKMRKKRKKSRPRAIFGSGIRNRLKIKRSTNISRRIPTKMVRV
jgi:hypothetical protein